MEGARAALEEYLAARRALNWARVYRSLSASARQAYRQSDLEAFFKSYRAYSFREVGEPREEGPGWVRFPVRGVRWELQGAGPLEGREWWVTVHYEEGRWGVGLADPLVDQAREAVRSGDIPTLNRVADTMLAIDPWSYRGHLQKAMALALEGRQDAAAAELEEARRTVPEELRAEVLFPSGNLFRALPQPALAVRAYEEALSTISRYPGFYEASFEAAVRLAMAGAEMQLGDFEGAARNAAVAVALDPTRLDGNLLAVSLAALLSQSERARAATP